MDFDREELRRTLAEAKLGGDEKTFTIIANRLRVIEHRYRACIGERRQGPSQDELSVALNQIQGAATVILNAIDETLELETLLFAFGLAMRNAVTTVNDLRDTAERALFYLAHEGSRRRTEAPETSFFLDLFDLGATLLGKDSLSDEGPLCRFIRACSSVVGIAAPNNTPSALRLRIMGANKRRDCERSKFPCKASEKPLLWSLHV